MIWSTSNVTSISESNTSQTFTCDLLKQWNIRQEALKKTDICMLKPVFVQSISFANVTVELKPVETSNDGQ